jgi:RNA polymerase sigma factor (sigma-70 family)
MAALQANVLRRLCRLATNRHTRQEADAELLAQFITLRDEAAFAALVERHGPTVLSVCRSMLRHQQDAEDVFQATFLTLARKASSIRKHSALGSWLHGVAYRVARRARANTANRRRHEQLACAGTITTVMDDLTWRELRAVLHEEIERLPEKNRLALLLCYWEGLTQEEAAKRLGLSKEALKDRLERARKLLRSRLVRRGLTPAVPLLAVGLSPCVVSASLVEATTRAAVQFVAGQAMGAVSATVIALAKGGIPTLAKLKNAALLVIVGILAAGGLASSPLIGEGPLGEAQAESPRPALSALQQRTAADPKALTDRHGDPLPAGAIARLGTVRFRPGAPISTVILSPDGKVVAVGNWGKGIYLYDTATGKELHRFAEEQTVNTLSFSPDGKRLASADRKDNAIRLWDVATVKEVGQFTGHSQGVESVAFSPDGTTLASSSNDKTVRLWDVATGKEMHKLEGHRSAVYCVAWSPNGKTLVSRGHVDDKSIRLWDTATGKLLHQLNGHSGSIFRLAWSPDGKTLASGGSDGTLRLWTAATGKEAGVLGADKGERPPPQRPLEKAPPQTTSGLGSVHGLAYTPDGKALIAGSQFDPTIFVWDVTTGKELRRLEGPQRVFCLSLSADGKRLAVGGSANQVDLWDLTRDKLLHPFEGHQGRAFAAVFSPDGKMLASGGEDQICLWETSTWREMGRLKGHDGQTHRLAFSPDGRTLATSDDDFMIRVWDLNRRKAVRSYGPARNRPGSFDVVISPDGKMLAGNLDDVVVWDLATGKELHSFKQQGERPVHSEMPAFAPDGRTLAFVSEGAIHLCDPVTGKVFRRFEVPAGRILSIAFSADGKSLLTGGEGRVLRVWEVATGRERCRFEGHEIDVHSVAIAPGGRIMASASGAIFDHRDDSVRLWDGATGKQLCRLCGHRNAVVSVAFAPDGKALASASEDNTVLIWDTAGLLPSKPARANGASAKELESHWNDLANDDAARAYRAIWALAAAPESSVAFLKERLKPAAPRDAKQVERLIKDLDSEQFDVRRKAAEQLEALGEPAAPLLRKALKGELPLEARRQVERLLDKLEQVPPELLRALRAIEALEHIGTPDARRVLEAMAKGIPETRQASEAKAALERLLRAGSP